MVNFDNFGGLKSVLKFHIFLMFNCEELVQMYVWTGSIFLRYEESVLNFHKCEGSVPVLHTCEEFGTQFSQM